MATEKQTAANQANAKLSTGPKTDEGKDISRRNGLIHGLAGLGFVRPEHWETEILETADWLQSTLKPDNVFEVKLGNTMAFHVTAFEDANRLQIARKLVISLETLTTWDDKHLTAAAALAETLASKPASVARRLRGSKHGCLVMIEGWHQLDGVLIRAGKLDDDQKSMALDLLGISNAVRKTGSVLDVPEGVAPREHLRGIVRAEVKKLEAKIEEGGLGVLDKAKYDLALLGIDPLDDQMRVLKRYSREHFSIILKIRREFSRVDRLGYPGLPSGMPTKRPHESRSEFYERVDDWKSRNRIRAEKELEIRNAQRLKDNAIVEFIEENPQPIFHEGMPLNAYIQLVTDWNRKRNATLAPLPEVPPGSQSVSVTSMADALPPESEPDDEDRPDYPSDPDDVPPAAPVKKPRKRHNK